jgi:hypothetical protein
MAIMFQLTPLLGGDKIFTADDFSYPHWRENPYRLVSLMEILRTRPEAFCKLIGQINRMLLSSDLTRRTKEENQANLVNGIVTSFGPAVQEAQRLGFASSVAHLQRILASIRSGSWSGEDFLYDLRALHDRMIDDLEARFFLAVPFDRVKYYDQKEPLFGENVFNHFPRTIIDIEEAGKCLALGRATACVFHLMRVMEDALKIVAIKLEIPYAPGWESYIKQIDKKISVDHKDKTLEWKKDEPFYRDLLGDFQTVKWAWRNPTMHIVRQYTIEEAESIFQAVRGFMQRLAEKFTESDETIV